MMWPITTGWGVLGWVNRRRWYVDFHRIFVDFRIGINAISSVVNRYQLPPVTIQRGKSQCHSGIDRLGRIARDQLSDLISGDFHVRRNQTFRNWREKRFIAIVRSLPDGSGGGGQGAFGCVSRGSCRSGSGQRGLVNVVGISTDLSRPAAGGTTLNGHGEGNLFSLWGFGWIDMMLVMFDMCSEEGNVCECL